MCNGLLTEAAVFIQNVTRCQAGSNNVFLAL
jgi:hypothetical protein